MRRYGWILIAASIWTLYVWITRIFTLVPQNATRSFKVVHGILIVISIGFGLVVGWIGLRLLRRA